MNSTDSSFPALIHWTGILITYLVLRLLTERLVFVVYETETVINKSVFNSLEILLQSKQIAQNFYFRINSVL